MINHIIYIINLLHNALTKNVEGIVVVHHNAQTTTTPASISLSLISSVNMVSLDTFAIPKTGFIPHPSPIVLYQHLKNPGYNTLFTS